VPVPRGIISYHLISRKKKKKLINGLWIISLCTSEILTVLFWNNKIKFKFIW
jgi:hypothetical protein